MAPKKKPASEFKQKVTVKKEKGSEKSTRSSKRKCDEGENKPIKKEKSENSRVATKRKSDEVEKKMNKKVSSKKVDDEKESSCNLGVKPKNEISNTISKQGNTNAVNKRTAKVIESKSSSNATKKNVPRRRSTVKSDNLNVQLNVCKEVRQCKTHTIIKTEKTPIRVGNNKITESTSKLNNAKTKGKSKSASKSKSTKVIVNDVENNQLKEESSSSESEWEEVAEEPTDDIEDYKPDIPEEGIEITLEGPAMPKKRQKKVFDMMEYIRLEINRDKKEQQLIVHQVHLLCLLARGIYINKILLLDELKAIAFSLIPTEFVEVKIDKVDVDYVHKLVNWFRSSFILDENLTATRTDVKKSIYKCFQQQTASSIQEYNMMFIVVARALCLNVRLCLSFYPLSFKATNLLKKGEIKNACSKASTSGETRKNVPKKSENNSKPGKAEEKSSKLCSTLPNTSSKRTSSTKSKNAKEKNLEIKSKFNTKLTNRDSIVNRCSSKRSIPRKSYKYSSNEDNDDDAIDDDFKLREDSSSDGDNPNEKQPRKRSVKQKPKVGNRKILSSESGPSSPETGKSSSGIECWLEIFIKKETKWISVECFNNIINKPYHIETVAKQPVTYVICYDNLSFLKDVTKRYSSQWMTCTRKLRVAHDWWLDSLEPFLPPDTKQHRDEESQMEAALLRKPMPSTISEFKNHPLYALKRHLLKFQAIYPPDAPSIGFVRGEPVYARECIHSLHSRETWLKEARLVRVNEEPYKIVKARPKWNRLTGIVTTDLPLNLYGRWQTEDYMPPIAWNGKVPRNEYGNVELFKPCMLPVGTVHLRNAGLNRIAKKLNIDCSPAVVGFDGHKGSIHPVFDGFIICEEFKDTILAAWEEEQENIRKREEAKREKRVYGNWRRLIKGLLIRERLKVRYAL